MAITSAAPTLAALQLNRCDYCRALGRVRWQLPSGLDLVFCVHHGREHAPALRASNATPGTV